MWARFAWARQCAAYAERLRNGLVDGTARPTCRKQAGAVIHIDGNRTFGKIAGAWAVGQGVNAAKTLGIAVTAVTGCSHLGWNGKWPSLAAASGVASLHFINAPAAPSAVTPHDGAKARLTNNPIALGAPHPEGAHVIADFAIGAFSINAMLLAVENGKKMASASIVTPNGTLTDDPAAFIGADERAMLGFGGYKGFAIGLFSEILAGALTGGGVHDREGSPDSPNNMLSIYLDVASLTDTAHYADSIRSLVAWIESTPALKSGATVTVPGGRSRALREAAQSNDIPLPPSLLATINEAARNSGDFNAFANRWPTLFT